MSSSNRILHDHSFRKPVVVLAGWLGCKLSNLRRYQEFYSTRGYSVILRVATPRMVFGAALETDLAQNFQVKANSFPRSSASSLITMQDLAWDVLREVHHQHPAHRFILHCFSNGGCFLYEQILQIFQRWRLTPQFSSTLSSLAAPGADVNVPSKNIVPTESTIIDFCDNDDDPPQPSQFQLVAVVFDSCPALDLSLIKEALSYCSQEERIEVKSTYPHLFSSKNGSGDAATAASIHGRQVRYHDFLLNVNPNLPQLYIYSRQGDPLVPVEPLESLIQARRQRYYDSILHLSGVNRHYHQQQQHENISSCSNSSSTYHWIKEDTPIHEVLLDHSSHCAHWLHHPDTYKQNLDLFLHKLLLDSSISASDLSSPRKSQRQNSCDNGNAPSISQPRSSCHPLPLSKL